MPGNLPLSQGNLPLSTITPPSVVPWPARYLVAECTTMSAPSASGLHRNGLGHGVVDDQRQPVRMRHVGHRGDVEHRQAGVAQALGEDRAGVGLDRRGKGLGLGRIDEAGCDAELGQVDRQHRHAAAVQRAGGHHMVAGLQQGHQRHRLGRHAAGRGHRGAPAFQRRDALLQRRDRRVAQARIDIAEGLQVEQAAAWSAESKTKLVVW